MENLLVHQLQSPTSWREIRLEGCDDGEFNHSPVCQAWANQLATFIVAKLGTSPRIRINAYSSGGDTFLAVDAFNDHASEYIALTILMTKTSIYLSGPAGDQFDIALPGLIDSLGLLGSLCSFTQGILEPA